MHFKFKNRQEWKLLVMCATVKSNKGHLCRNLVPGEGMPRDSVSGLVTIQLVVALAPP